MKQEVQTAEVETKEVKKTVISLSLFEKKVEMEYAFLTYQEGVPEKEALRKARATISAEYEVAKRREG